MTTSKNEQLPGVSIILAVRNEAEHLDDCLRALATLDYPGDKLEILLVDGMSDDGTAGIIAEWAGRDGRIKTTAESAQDSVVRNESGNRGGEVRLRSLDLRTCDFATGAHSPVLVDDGNQRRGRGWRSAHNKRNDDDRQD